MSMPHALVPSTYVMEIFEFEEGDRTYQRINSAGTTFPGGLPVARLRQQFGGNEGEFTGPSGGTYFISLDVWKGRDSEKTLLQMVFRTTPLFPADIDPELRQASFSQGPTPPSSPPATTAKGVATPSSLGVGSKRRHVNDFISCSDVRREHRLKIQRSSTPDAGFTADALLTRPEITATDVHCPVCNAKITFGAPLDKRLQQGIEWWGSEATIQLIFEHPIDIEETQTISSESPFIVHRYRRYTPISVPLRLQDPAIELSIVLKSHDHLITLVSGRGETTAQMLLPLPEAKATELLCPYCDEKLPVEEPFEQYIRILAEDANGDTTPIEWNISHPRGIAATKTPVPGSLIRAKQHSTTDDFAQKQYEGYPSFVVRRKET